MNWIEFLKKRCYYNNIDDGKEYAAMGIYARECLFIKY